MSDLRLITILPSQPVQGVQQPQVTGNQLPSPGISSIPAGSILNGFIINRDKSGNPIMRTDSGDITFASNFFLKIGSEITIRIENFAGNNSAHILSVNGQSPEVAVLQSGLTNEPEVIVNVGNTNSNVSSSINRTDTQPNQNPVLTVKGMIISTPQNSTPNILSTSPQTLPLPNGTMLALRINNIATPEPVHTQPVSTAPTNNPAKNTSTIQTTTPQADNTSYASYARFVHTPPPATQSEATTTQPTIKTAVQTTLAEQPQPAKIGQQIITTVISNNKAGEAIIQSPIGIIKLQAGTQLPINSNITFEIAEINTVEVPDNLINNTISSVTTLPSTPITSLARSSGALSNIFVLLTNLGTTDALSFVKQSIPTINIQAGVANSKEPPNNIMSALLGFVSALRSGDFRQWLGRTNVSWLENNGHEMLLQKAEGEFASLSRQFTNPPAQQWQSLFFPIAIDGELQQTRLFVKRDKKEKNNNGTRTTEEDTRFVVEMDMSQLGQMQMDGFVKRNNQNIQFDLIIRSHTALSPEAQKDIMYIYNDMAELTGYKGSITFQNVKDFPVNPMEEIISADDIDDVLA